MIFISCRNLLIYLNPDVQKKVIALFHYALVPRGFLFLGTAETVGDQSTHFSIVDRRWKIYKRLESDRPRKTLLMSDSDQRVADYLITSRGKEAVIKSKNPSLRELAERTLLESFTPCAVIINEKGAILYVHGRSGKYLEVGPGEANLNLVAMTREGLRFEMASAIKTAFAEGKEIRHERLRVKTNGDEQVINLIVRPILQNTASNGFCMVVFEDASSW